MIYPSIRIEGSILSPDILEKLEDANGQRPADFGLETSDKVKDEIARAWADAQDYWRIYQRKLETLKEDSPATTETRNLWIVPLLGLLGYQLEFEAKSIELNGKLYPISHRVTNRDNAAIHIIGSREPAGLDRKPEKTALKMSAHAMMQEYLNLTEQLYGIVTNGRLLRLLRDSSRLVKLTYLEFDLDRIFNDGLFADFAVLYRLLHVTRLPAKLEESATCLLEKYHQETIEQGSRIREGLRVAVTDALQSLGTGFLAHPGNSDLRQQVNSGELKPDAYFNYVLRLVYRLLFLMVIEERNLVFPKGTSTRNSTIYFQHYSVQRLRRLANTRGLQVARHHDAWQQLLSTFHLFENSSGAAILGTTAMGGQLFSPTSLGPLAGCRLSNAALFVALEKLCYFTHPQNGQRMPVNFGALATEEFGSVYESLLELHPVIEIEPAPYFGFRQAAGNERKTSGSYYTPSSLVDCLLDSALDPLLQEAEKAPSPEKAILALKVCDPACGSGHFLIAAAQRIARRLARLRAGDEEPSPELMRHTHREVISHCIFGVDINPMSVELCKVGLWLEAVEPGKPLTFLDHHIKCGNSLLGATPQVINNGIPDKAYDPIAGDNKEAAKWMKKLNQKDRTGQTRFDFDAAHPWERLGNLPVAIAQLEQLDDDTPESLVAKEARYRQLVESSAYDNARLLHDAWCAAFVWRKISTDYGEELTSEHLQKIERNPHSVKPYLKEKVRSLARQYRFFHWHLEFPGVFRSDCDGGFDCMIGNPPWDQVVFREQEFFSACRPDIAHARSEAARCRLVEKLQSEDSALHYRYTEAKRFAEGTRSLIQNSGLYPLTGRGRTNTFALFCELSQKLLTSKGRLGCIVPTGIATDDTTKFYFQKLMETNSLISLYDFENRKGLFPAVDSRMKFSLLTTGSGRAVPIGREPTDSSDFVFFAHSVDDLNEKERHFALTTKDIKLLNPNTKTCCIFRSNRDAEITRSIHGRIPVLWQEDGKGRGNSWHIVTRPGLFNMASDSSKFSSIDELLAKGCNLVGNVFYHDNNDRFFPLYEGKMFTFFDHRYAGVKISETAELRQGQPDELGLVAHQSPNAFPIPRYWVSENELNKQVGKEWDKLWIPGWKEITSSTNERTLISCLLPLVGIGHKIPIFLPDTQCRLLTPQLVACLSSYVCDFVSRQKLGTASLTPFTIKQLPVLPPDLFEQNCPWRENKIKYDRWLLPRIVELTYTAWDMKPFAEDYGFDGPPFLWDEERRFQLRCELDAAFFHLYGIERDDVDYIMETFPSVKRKDEAQFASYRTKDTILKIYDELGRVSSNNVADVIAGREAVALYQTKCDPEPGPPVGANGNFISMYQWDQDNWPTHIHQPHPNWVESLMAAWFDVCQQRGTSLEDDQIFPRAGRETFVYALLPYLVQERPGEQFEFYRDAALLASRPTTLERLLLDDNLSSECRQLTTAIPWLNFADGQRIDPRRIRETLQKNQIIHTAANSAVTEVHGTISLPPLPIELTPLLSLILKAADNLDKMQRRALEDAEAAKITFSQDEIANELKTLFAA
ncbi:Eco57I restriction-modification methylase domain-containing protein [Geobacter anodireducens]